MLARAPISVVVPAYNGGRFIGRAIESVQTQTLPISEIIVVDDGSSDGTYEIAKNLGVQVIRQAHRGVSAARNTGICAARNEWIAFIDQDDLWEPEKIQSQWAAIELHPDIGLVSCSLRWFEDEGIRDQSFAVLIDPPSAEEACDGRVAYWDQLKIELPLSRIVDYPSNVLIRRDLLLRAGMFDENLSQNEDLECFLRLIAKSSFAIVQRPLVRRRIHDKNTSLNDPDGATDSYYKILDWLRDYPEKYPADAARAYNSILSRSLIATGRALLDSGQRREARALLGQSIRRIWSQRAMVLWLLTFFRPGTFKYLSAIKRKFS
jgi:glycosyltransferase involved in cell wall biosynthesis